MHDFRDFQLVTILTPLIQTMKYRCLGKLWKWKSVKILLESLPHNQWGHRKSWNWKGWEVWGENLEKCAVQKHCSTKSLRYTNVAVQKRCDARAAATADSSLHTGHCTGLCLNLTCSNWFLLSLFASQYTLDLDICTPDLDFLQRGTSCRIVRSTELVIKSSPLLTVTCASQLWSHTSRPAIFGWLVVLLKNIMSGH